jgi:hypothetical protein
MNTTNPELTVAVWQSNRDAVMENPAIAAVAQARAEYPKAQILGVRQLSQQRIKTGRWVEMAVEMRFI